MLSFAGALGSLPYVAVVAAIGFLWNVAVENPQIRATAREGYAAVAEVTALRAQLAERERQAEAALKAGTNFAEVLRQQADAMADRAAEQERRNVEYEAKLKAAGRACLLDDDDLRELQR